jgi:hypothetical protein
MLVKLAGVVAAQTAVIVLCLTQRLEATPRAFFVSIVQV